MDRRPLSDADRTALEERLGYRFAREALLIAALTHCSSTSRVGAHNETLEFLGDAVVGLVVSDLLHAAWPEADEGSLSRRRAALVNAKSLAERAQRLELGDLLALGRGEAKTGGREKTSILAGAFEALVGAVYRDGGYAPAHDVVTRAFAGEIEQSLDEASDAALGDYKTRLQELCQRVFRTVPAYTLLRATGPDHAKAFECRVELGDRVLGHGRGGSKKDAEQAAAREGLALLQAELEAAAPVESERRNA
ncbi:MAG: ribonuclease III [Deltaproteobacteria bacterium]|nr:ribonuclease III [Deltaproteobacteria bacterium]